MVNSPAQFRLFPSSSKLFSARFCGQRYVSGQLVPCLPYFCGHLIPHWGLSPWVGGQEHVWWAGLWHHLMVCWAGAGVFSVGHVSLWELLACVCFKLSNVLLLEVGNSGDIGRNSFKKPRKSGDTLLKQNWVLYWREVRGLAFCFYGDRRAWHT